MTVSRVWALNYDAESELAGAATARMPLIDRPPWIARGEPVLGEDLIARPDGAAPRSPSGDPQEKALGVAWCPTPRALAALQAAGIERLVEAPDASILKAANARETFADVHPLAAFGAVVVGDVEGVERAVARAAPERPSGRAPAWLLRRSLGAAGQGRLLAEGWTEEVAAWVERALSLGPVHVMPYVDIDEEFSAHAFLHQDGRVELGQHVRQVVRGAAWVSATRRERPVQELANALGHAVERLRSMGYFGPLGVDGFVWRDASGARCVAAGTDVNARYTMSMGAGFRDVP